MPDATDQRPPVAVGHVRLNVVNVGAAARWLETVGLRPIVTMSELAMLELRGGTHVVVSRPGRRPRPGRERRSTSKSEAIERLSPFNDRATAALVHGDR